MKSIGIRHAGEVELSGSDAVFEIGSLTKPITATLLALLVHDGVVAFDDPVARFLPVAPAVRGRPITLEDLATHRSGLPRVPKGIRFADRRDPYARFDATGLPAAIAATPPKAEPGARTVYSSLGYGLLGLALARAAGTTYAELVRERITRPLGMDRTGLDTPGLAQGRTWLGRAAGPWNLAELAGAGGLRSTAEDVLRFLALHDPDAEGPLAEAARETRRPRARYGAAQLGLGWAIMRGDRGRKRWRIPHEVLIHDGGTGGFRSHAAVIPATGTAVVVLSSRARSVTRESLRTLTAAVASTPGLRV